MKENKNTGEILVRIDNKKYIPVDDWTALQLYLTDNIFEVNFFFGRYILSENEKNVIILEDRLEPLAQNLYLNGAKQLLINKDHSFRIWDYNSTVSLTIKDDTVAISGDHFTPAIFPKQMLIASFLECAEKVMALMQKLHIHCPEYNFSVFPYFDELFAECQKLYEEKYGWKSR